jgi:hypothetical protein
MEVTERNKLVIVKSLKFLKSLLVLTHSLFAYPRETRGTMDLFLFLFRVVRH